MSDRRQDTAGVIRQCLQTDGPGTFSSQFVLIGTDGFTAWPALTTGQADISTGDLLAIKLDPGARDRGLNQLESEVRLPVALLYQRVLTVINLDIKTNR